MQNIFLNYVFFALFMWSPLSEAAGCTIDLVGTDAMQFDTKNIHINYDECKEVTINLKHSGSLSKNIMGHNIVITKASDAQAVLKDAISSGMDRNYIRTGDPRVIAHSKLIGGGENTSIRVDASKLKAGESYQFFCSFPGHLSMMKGSVLVENANTQPDNHPNAIVDSNQTPSGNSYAQTEHNKQPVNESTPYRNNNSSTDVIDTIALITSVTQAIQSQKSFDGQQKMKQLLQVQQLREQLQSTYNQKPASQYAYQNQSSTQTNQLPLNNTNIGSNSRAPHINGECIQFGVWGKDRFTAEIKQMTSNCKVPVEVVYCFYIPGQPNSCNDGIGWGNSNKIQPGGTTLATQRSTKHSSYMYYVCDMSDPSKQLCIRPK